MQTSKPSNVSPNQKLRNLRLKRLWSQEKLAEMLGTTKVNVSRWERGVTFPTLYFRRKLCETFELSPHDLGLDREEAGVSADSPPLQQDASPEIPGVLPQPPLHGSPTQPTPPLSPSQLTPYRVVLALPPPTDPRTIQQREQTVEDIYAQLIEPGVTAIVITGIGGVGKSTLAALLYRYAEEQRRADNEPFTADALWLRIDPS